MRISTGIGLFVLVMFLVGPAAGECPKGDLTGDCTVNFADVQALAARWLYPQGNAADFDGLNGVEERDFAILAGTWGQTGINLVVNEVMASNSRTKTDPQGQYDDWIEIYNPGAKGLYLAGMHLTDNLDNPTKWQIPYDNINETLIMPGGYLLIWADNDTTAPTGLHASFELNADSGDEVGLFDVNGVFIDSVKFPRQDPDISYERYPDGNDTWRFSGRATPKMANMAAYNGEVADTKFSHNRGFYYAPFSVLITTETDGAKIYYTLDGSSPFDLERDIPRGILYTTGVAITTTTPLRAVAVKNGWKHTNIDAQTYIFPDDVLQQATNPSTGAQVTPSGYPTIWDSGSGSRPPGDYQIDPDIVNHATPSDRLAASDLLAAPTMSLVVKKGDFFDLSGIYLNEQLTYRVDEAAEKAVSVEYIDPVSGESTQINCAVAMAGGASGGGTSLGRWKSYKLSMRPRFKATLDDGTYTGGPSKLNFKVFADSPIDKFDSIVFDGVLNHSWLHTSNEQRNSVTYIQDQYMSDIHNAMGGYSPHGIHGYLYINGLHWGMYYFHERPDHNWAAEMFGGDGEQYDAIKHGTGNPDYAINNAFDVYGHAFSSYGAMVSAAGAVASDPTNLAKYDALCDVLDVDNFITYLISNWYGGNTDWPHKNWYATSRGDHPEAKWRFHTWDAEHAMDKGINAGDINGKIGNSPNGIHAYLDGSAEYLIRFADLLHENFFNDGPMTPKNTADMWIARMATADRAIVGESARWGDNRNAVAHTRSQWLAVQQNNLDTFFPARSDDLMGLLTGRGLYPAIPAPAFYVNGSAQHGGNVSAADSLSMAAGAADIYYTIDGSDPRLPGGAVDAAHAMLYSGVFNLSHSMHVKARAKSGGTWSAMNETVYAVGPVVANLRINEIMYNPLDTGDPNDPNKEYVELWNIGLTTINLNLVSFTNGIDFTFGDFDLPPNEMALVVRNEEVFLREYGTSWGILAGEYSGKLDNGGERVELQDALGETIQTFRYKDGWYDITDGEGFSLTIVDPTDSKVYRPDLGLVSHWQMDDGFGTTATDSAGGYDGTLHGDAAWTDGRVDDALTLDGGGDYVSFPSHGTLTTADVTIEAWINVSSTGGLNSPIVMQHDSTNKGYRFNVVSDKPTFAIIVQGRGVVIMAASLDSITKNEWHHIAGTNDGADLKLYVNGEFKRSASSVGYTGVDHEAYIGYDHSSGSYWDGLIDDVRIYNRALGEHEFAGIGQPLDRWDAKKSWRASGYPGGSPGWDDSVVVVPPGGVAINEIMAHSHAEAPDWIELYNSTDKSVQIGGWYLSDSKSNPKKYRIASNTRIPSLGYKVFYEDLHFGKASDDPGSIMGFGFSENGEQACLTSAQTGILTGYREFESFGASFTGVSLGRHYKTSTGTYNFVPLDFNTPGKLNAYPAIGPIVISEIMYNPDWPIGGTYGNDRYEYIELENVTDEPVKLWREDKLLAWKFSAGIDYTFPASPDEVTIAPGEHIVVVRDVLAFTERYPGVAAEKVFGPYDGQLDNAGERVQLSKPGDKDKFGRQHYIRIDRVTYSDGHHASDLAGGVDLWPTQTDSGGMSLTRVTPSLYGNDPNNWTASTPSPGD